jgi:peptidoglycan/xylan/chitin deacetylase (PgdA/CDA1 family)
LKLTSRPIFKRASLVAFFAAYLVVSQQPAKAATTSASCTGTVYLTLDTGNMRDASNIAQTLSKHQIKATFFVANEESWPDRKTSALEEPWRAFWQARVAEGHIFGSHTWRHGLISKSEPARNAEKRANTELKSISYKPQFGEQAGQKIQLSDQQFCAELHQPSRAFERLTGQKLSAIWRAPGGRTNSTSIEMAERCGYKHVHWASTGFLGDELPSEQYPNDLLLKRALRDVKDGDVLMAHLGIWSRKERFNTIFEPLVVGLKERGLCFATLAQHPEFAKHSSTVGGPK